MAAGRSAYAKSDGLRIAYEVRRSRWRRRPWMALVQVLGFDRSGWAPVVKGLAAHFALILVDNRGSGRSDQPTRRLAAHQRSRRGGAGGWYAQMAAGARFGDLRQGSITAPTLVLHGTDDRVVDPRNARLLADRIPHARLEMLPGLGHLFFWEAPDVFVDAVTRFALAPPPMAATSRKEPS